MKATYVNSFIESTKEIFKNNLNLQLEITSIVKNIANVTIGDIAVLIGMTEDVKGASYT